MKLVLFVLCTVRHLQGEPRLHQEKALNYKMHSQFVQLICTICKATGLNHLLTYLSFSGRGSPQNGESVQKTEWEAIYDVNVEHKLKWHIKLILIMLRIRYI